MKTFKNTKIEKQMNIAKDKFKQVDLYLEADKMDFREAEEYRLAALKTLQRAIEANIKQLEFNIEAVTL